MTAMHGGLIRSTAARSNDPPGVPGGDRRGLVRDPVRGAVRRPFENGRLVGGICSGGFAGAVGRLDALRTASGRKNMIHVSATPKRPAGSTGPSPCAALPATCIALGRGQRTSRNGTIARAGSTPSSERPANCPSPCVKRSDVLDGQKRPLTPRLGSKPARPGRTVHPPPHPPGRPQPQGRRARPTDVSRRSAPRSRPPSPRPAPRRPGLRR